MSEARFGPYVPTLLPKVIRQYLEAHQRNDRESLADTAFGPDATVIDENVKYVGTGAIRDWLANAANEYTYTTDYTAQTAHTPRHWTVRAHIEGDFPGGQADLRFEFRLDEDKIEELVIEP